MEHLLNDAVDLLRRLIATPRVSREEGAAADLLERQMAAWQLHPRRHGNNVWAVCPRYDETRPTLLLNAHIDTVRPAASWTREPFVPTTEGDRLYGLGSNDCGGGLTTLLQVFRAFCSPNPPTCNGPGANLVFLASAEEEVSGKNGMESMTALLPHVDVAIVGEPTGMQPAIAEKGLMVIDAEAHGKSGHAARDEGVNAIYEALDDLAWLRSYRFERVSQLLGPTKMSVTIVNAGTQHNVVPDTCRFTIDVRTNELYTNEEVFDIIRRHCKSDMKARSFRLHSSHIDSDHPLVARCRELGLQPFGSPTLSDQALMPWPSLKLGPGESARSHSADEFIGLSELEHALQLYTRLLSGLELCVSPVNAQSTVRG